MTAPYEADAQLRSLEEQGITIGSLSSDGDLAFLGRSNATVHSGFSTRSTKNYRSIIGGKCRLREYEGLTASQRAVLAGFHGTDYLGKLYRWSPRTAFEKMQHHMRLNPMQREQHLDQLEQQERWSKGRGQARAVGFADGFRLNLCLFMHYPVYKFLFSSDDLSVNMKRQEFSSRRISVRVEPLNPFVGDDSFASLLPSLDICDHVDKDQLWLTSKWRGQDFVYPPYPRHEVSGEELPHGAVLNFDTRAPHLWPDCHLLNFCRLHLHDAVDAETSPIPSVSNTNPTSHPIPKPLNVNDSLFPLTLNNPNNPYTLHQTEQYSHKTNNKRKNNRADY